MATYLSADLNGSGSLGEILSGTKTFTVTNYKASDDNYHVVYLTLEGNATANQNLTSNVDFTGTFGSFTGGANEDSIVASGTKWSISISGVSGAFTFTPTTTVPALQYYIKGAGNFDLNIS